MFCLPLYIHQRFHWRTWIEEFGAPVYYSTMHWESKHKQLKLTKDKTNNHQHHKDLLLKDMQKTVHKLMHYYCSDVDWVSIYAFFGVLYFC